MSVGSQRVRVLLAEDDADVRDAIADLIATEESLDLVAKAADAEEAVELAMRLRPDVAVLDVKMPGGGGPRATRAIRSAFPRTQVVALSAHGDRESVLEMIRAGAVGYLVKGLPGEELLSAIVRGARGQTSLSASVAGEVVDELMARLEGQNRDHEARRATAEQIRAVLLLDSIKPVFQPIADLRTGEVVGYESLARFGERPERTPDAWFSQAHEVGLGVQLELSAVRVALQGLKHLPGSTYLSVNVSPATALSLHFVEAVEGTDLSRLVIEITEHAPVSDYEALAGGLRPLRQLGARLAVDDAGAGFASLRHILRLSPDIIKLDGSLTSNIDSDPAREALSAAIIVFADRIGSTVVAEGIEREQELLVLRSLGVPYGQGFYLARPAPLAGPGDAPTVLAVPQSSEIE